MAKYAQYITVYKDNHLNLLLKPQLLPQLMEAAKLKSGSETNRKKKK
jgi:hypothetical protein